MATTLVLFRTSPAYQALGKDLEARGFAFADADTPTGVLRPDGSSVIFSMDRARNVKTFDARAEGDGSAFAAETDALGADALPFLFALLGGSLWSWGTVRTANHASGLAPRSTRPRSMVRRSARARARLSRGDLPLGRGPRALGPWVLHAGLGPESAYSAEMAKVIAFAIEAAGCPIAVGGAKTLLQAFERLIADQGGATRGTRRSCASSRAGARAAGSSLRAARQSRRPEA